MSVADTCLAQEVHSHQTSGLAEKVNWCDPLGSWWGQTNNKLLLTTLYDVMFHSYCRFGSTSVHHQSLKPRVSTEELMRNQTDWLKEFRQNVPLSSQLKLTGGAHSSRTARTTPSAPAHSHLRSTTGSGTGGTTAGGGAGASVMGESHHHKLSSSTLLPSKPKLMLDSSNSVQLVHV